MRGVRGCADACVPMARAVYFLLAARRVSGRTRFRFSLFSPDFLHFSACESVPHVS
jgi:hypothetical protein